MKNNRAKRKAFFWKHLMSRVSSKPYMALKRKLKTRKSIVRFDVAEYRRVINAIISQSDMQHGFPGSLRGDNASTMTRGVWFDYRNMKHRICGVGNGVKWGNTKIKSLITTKQ